MKSSLNSIRSGATFYFFLPLSLLSLTLLSSIILSATYVSADDDTSIVDEINITVPVSCTLNGTGMNSHNAEINNGQYNSAIGETTLKAFCNDNEGFAIYAIGYTDNEEGKNVLTNSTLGSTHDIVTGTATGGTDSNWAMKLSTIISPTPTYPIIIAGTNDDTLKEQDDPDYNTFQEVPDDYTKVAYRTSNTDIGTSAEGSTLTTTYQAYISPTQPAGTYTGQVKYTLIHPHTAEAPEKEYLPIDCPAGYICYSPASYYTSGTMNVQDVGTYSGDTTSVIGYQSASSNSNVTLIAPNFKRTGYGFAGWNTELDGTGTDYGPNQDITTPDLSENGLALYAKWVPSSGEMQSWTGCSSLATNQVIGLTDNRDQNVYAVAKLADGNCWMVENLRLDGTATITSENTNNPASGFVLGSSSDSWCTDSNATCINQSFYNKNNSTINGKNSNNEELISTPDYGNRYENNNVQWYGYGNYYNWYTATSGNGTYSSSGYYNGENTNGDICPSGWSLPTGGQDVNNRQYNSLANAITSGDSSNDYLLRSYPANFTYSGFWYNNRISNRKSDGQYQTRNAQDNGSNYVFDFFSANANGGNMKYSGFSVRCISKESISISNLTNMQDFRGFSSSDKSYVASSMAENTTYNLIDNRDNKTYTVAKLKDGNIWMAENLDLGRTDITTNLDYHNTNLYEMILSSTFNGWKKTSGTSTYGSGEFVSLDGIDATSGTPYGTLYNYYALSAGTISGSNSSSNATYDLCPAGWRLPTGGSSGEFQTLYDNYGSVASMRAPIANGGAAFAFAGLVPGGNPVSQGGVGSYWSSTTAGSILMNYMNLGSNFSNTTIPRYFGLSARCLVK